MRALRVLSLMAGLVLALGCGGGGSKGGSQSSPIQDGPTQLVATTNTAAMTIDLAWKPPTTAFDGYELEARIGTAAFQKVNSDLIPNTWRGVQIILSNAMPECTDLSFRLRAMRGTAPSAYSNEAATRYGLRSPTVYSVYLVPGGIQVHWTNNSLVADSLLLERGESWDSGATYAWTTIPGVPADATSWLDGGPFQEGAAYNYRLTYSKGQDKGQSVGAFYQTISMLPPSDLVVTPLVEGSRLTWKNHSQIATEVVVMRAFGVDSYPSYQEVAHLSTDATTYEDLSIATGYYTYRVEARKGGNIAAASAPVQVATLPPQAEIQLVPSLLTLPQSDTQVRSSQGAWFLSGPYAYDVRVRTPSGTAWIDHIPSNASGWAPPYFLLDSHDRPHMVYTRSVMQGSGEVALIHAWNDGAIWQSEEVARRILDASSTAGYTFSLDPQDRLHLVWRKQTAYGSTPVLEYASKTAEGAWVAETIDLASVPGNTYLSTYRLALDPTGQPHVFAGLGQSVQHATKPASGAWTTEILPTGAMTIGLYDFMEAVAPDSGTCVLFYSRPRQPYDGTTEILMTQRVSGVWDAGSVVAQNDSHSSALGKVAVSPDRTRIALLLSLSTGRVLKVWQGGAWKTTLLGPGGYYNPCLGFTPDNKVYVLQRIGWGGLENATFALYSETP